MPKIALPLLLLVAGLIAGFFVGRSTTPDVPAGMQPASSGTRTSTITPGITQSMGGVGNEDMDEDDIQPAPAGFTVEQALAITDIDDRDIALEQLGMRAGLGDPQQALAELEKISRTMDKEMYMYGFVESFATRDAEACLAFLSTMPPGMLRETGFEHALELIAEEDPALAATKASQILQGVSAFNALLSISDVWAASDPDSALAWATAQEANQFRAATVEQIAVTWGENEPAAAVERLRTAQGLTDDERNLALRAVLSSWAIEKPRAALDWARKNSGAISGSDPMNIALLNWASEEPSEAAAALVRENNPALLEATAAEIAGLWGSNAPTEAAKWVSALPADGVRTTATMQLLDEWMKVDANGATAWAKQLPEQNGLRQAAMQRIEEGGQRFGQGSAMHPLMQAFPMPEAAPEPPE